MPRKSFSKDKLREKETHDGGIIRIISEKNYLEAKFI